MPLSPPGIETATPRLFVALDVVWNIFRKESPLDELNIVKTRSARREKIVCEFLSGYWARSPFTLSSLITKHSGTFEINVNRNSN